MTILTLQIYYKKRELFFCYICTISNINFKNMAEDPLERIAREEKEKKSSGLKTTTIILGVVAAVLALTLAFIWYQKSSIVKIGRAHV